MLSGGAFLASEQRASLIRDLKTLMSHIQLQLNPRGEIDRNILKLLGDLPDLADSNQPTNSFGKAHDLLIAHAQCLLKEEWEKVKAEASGPFGRVRSAVRENLRLAEYRAFCNGSGAIPQRWEHG